MALPQASNGAVPRIVVVDIDRRLRAALADLLAAAGLIVEGTAGDPVAALELVSETTDLVVLDPRLPDLAVGRAFIGQLRQRRPAVRVVITGWGDAGEAQLDDGEMTYVPKSADPEAFLAATLAACAACGK